MGAADDTLIQVREEGGRVLLYTGTNPLHRARLLVRGACGLAGLAGLGLAAYSTWALLLAAAGLVSFLVLPGRLRQRRLLELDTARGVLQPQPPDGPAEIPVSAIRALRGAYQTQGWDPWSAVHALLEDGAEVPVLTLPGTDEALAECACRRLGTLLGCPAVYTGSEGRQKTCYTPADGAAVRA
jgi:hypothetical protein